MKKVVVMVSLAVSMLCMTACGNQVVEDTTTQTIASEEVAQAEEIPTTQDATDDIFTTLSTINDDVLATAAEVAAAENDFDKLSEIAKKFETSKNQYLNVMLMCNDDQTELKKQVQKTLKSLPTNVKEDTDEAKAAFTEKAGKVSDAVGDLQALMN